MLQVNLLSGYSSELKRRLSRSLTAIIAGITHAKPEAISVWIHEVDADNYSRGGETRQPGIGTANPATLVHNYLSAMEERDLVAAQSYLSDEFVMIFPGSGELTSLRQLVDWSRDHYRLVNKNLVSVTVSYDVDKVQVFVQGTLAGEWPDGTAFDSVRFIDRFEIQNDLLVRQEVWNDLAHARP